MSVQIKQNMIIMTRGDTLSTIINITDASGNKYIPTEDDKIRFALKRNYNDIEPLILKEIPYDTCELYLDSNDTKSLDQPAYYVYDIQITLSNGTVDTFISGKLKLVEEVD